RCYPDELRLLFDELIPNSAIHDESGTRQSRLNMRAASRPFITGMPISNTIRSGLTDCATRTASCPFEASPHTSKSASRAKISARICGIKQLSSTTRTRLRCGCSWDDGSYRGCDNELLKTNPLQAPWGNANSRSMRVPISKG